MSGTKGPPKTYKNDTSSGSAIIDFTPEDALVQRENDWPALHPQHRAFVEEYLLNGYKHREAAAVAGLKTARGIKLLRDPLVRAYISHTQDKILKSNIVTKDFIDAKLEDLYDMAVGDVKTDHIDAKMGVSFSAKKFHGTLALSILQERAKMNGVAPPEPDPGEDEENVDTEIHFHVKGRKSDVTVTRGTTKITTK